MTTYQVVPPSSKLVCNLKYSYSYTINHKVTNPFSDLGHHLEDGQVWSMLKELIPVLLDNMAPWSERLHPVALGRKKPLGAWGLKM